MQEGVGNALSASTNRAETQQTEQVTLNLMRAVFAEFRRPYSCNAGVEVNAFHFLLQTDIAG